MPVIIDHMSGGDNDGEGGLPPRTSEEYSDINSEEVEEGSSSKKAPAW
jgi:hypothetical protein